MIVKNFKWFTLLIIGLIVIAVIVGIICGGMNMGIDFTGGSLVTIEVGEDFNSEEFRQIVEDTEGVEGEVSVVKSGDNMTQAVVRMQATGDQAATDQLVTTLMENLQAKYPNATFDGIESVGGIASGDLIRSAILSVLLASILMMLYIWIRFDLYSGIGALIALAHDVIAMVAVMCIFQIQVDSTFIAACLTIVGYSINDPVIVFDRIRENMGALNPKEYSREKIVDISIRETLGRTINTSLTTLIMITALYIFGVQSIKIFTLPLIVGVAVGTYSSMFIAAPIWIKLLNKFGKKKHKRVKAIH